MSAYPAPSPAPSPATSPTTIRLGLDVHKESVTIAGLRGDAAAPDRVDRLPNDLPKLKRYLERLAGQGALRPRRTRISSGMTTCPFEDKVVVAASLMAPPESLTGQTTTTSPAVNQAPRLITGHAPPP